MPRRPMSKDEVAVRAGRLGGKIGGASRSKAKVRAARTNALRMYPPLEIQAEVIRANPDRPVKIGPALAVLMGYRPIAKYTSAWVIAEARIAEKARKAAKSP